MKKAKANSMAGSTMCTLGTVKTLDQRTGDDEKKLEF
jgi:hypothetical protein